MAFPKETASKSGKTAHANGTAHEWTKDEQLEAARLGGKTLAAQAGHMARLGELGRAKRYAKQRAEAEARAKNGVKPKPARVRTKAKALAKVARVEPAAVDPKAERLRLLVERVAARKDGGQ